MSQAHVGGHRATLRLSVVEGMLHAVMIGVSESYLGALAVELGHRNRALALLATVPLLAGAIAQLGAPWLTSALGGRRRLVVAGAALQAVTMLGFLELARQQERALLPFLAIKTAFWVVGSVIVPPWSAWMGDLTAGPHRTRYFAWRSAWISLALVAAFLGGGGWLHAGRSETLRAYGDLFTAAFVARALSALCLVTQHDPGGRGAPKPKKVRMRALALRVRWRVPLYMAAFMFGANVSIPFFTPYMLRTLGLDYWDYTALLSVSIMVKAVVFPLCHPLAKRIGMRALLLLAGVGVGLTPLLWCLTESVQGLCWVEAFAGCSWAMWEYATFQLMLVGSGTRFRLMFMSLAGTLTAVGQLSGALAGTLLLERFALSYREVFLVSSALRLSSLVVLAFQLDALLPPGHRLRRLAVRLVTVRPNSGGAVRPVVQDRTGPGVAVDAPDSPGEGPQDA